MRIVARPTISTACSLALLATNLILIWPLFWEEFSAHTASIEGTFVGIARVMAKYPGERAWWPFWNCGLPFELTYLPFTHWMAAGLTAITGLSAARCYHMFIAFAYAMGPVTVFWMAAGLSGRVLTSFVAGLAVSCVSVSTLLIPAMATDVGGALHLRRLHDLIVYGESPHIAALTLLPLAVLALARGGAFGTVAAGCAAAIVVLSNAFGAVGLAGSAVCLVLWMPTDPWWKGPVRMASIGVVSFCTVLPWLSPALLRAMRENAATSGGDFRYTPVTWVAAIFLVIGFAGVWWLLRRWRTPAPLGLFVLMAYLAGSVEGCWHIGRIAVVPQPHRFELEMDVVLLLVLVFLGSAVLERCGRRVRVAVTSVVLAGLLAQAVHIGRHARTLIRGVDPASLSEYKIAKWLEANRPGERAFVPGSVSLLFTAFTDTPQVHGGHDQHTRNSFLPIVSYTIYSGANAGARDAEFSIFWLKAVGARTVAVTGPRSTEFYKPYVNPDKFEGVLPLLWRDGDDAIYEVPGRTASLAHVIPRGAVAERRPVHGLDIGPVRAYVDALDDTGLALARMDWRNLNEAVVRTSLASGQVISVQVSYDAGWEARVNGRAQVVRSDGIGQLIIEPDCVGDCEIVLTYSGGWERILTWGLSVAAMLVGGWFLWRGWLER